MYFVIFYAHSVMSLCKNFDKEVKILTFKLCVCVCLQADLSDSPIHVVLGGPEPNVDTVAATLCLALHLNLVC